MKNWKSNVAIIILFIFFSVVLLVTFDDHVEMVKGFLFFMLLGIASYVDIKTRTIPDIIHVLIIIVGLININILDSLSGFIIVPLPFFIMAYVKEGSIGGGDVKLMAAIGFCVGFTRGGLGAFIGLLLFVISVGILSHRKSKNMQKSNPLVPSLGLGFVLVCLTYIRMV